MRIWDREHETYVEEKEFEKEVRISLSNIFRQNSFKINLFKKIFFRMGSKKAKK